MRGSDVILNADVDVDVLRCYCEAVSWYQQAAELCAKSGPIVRGCTGRWRSVPFTERRLIPGGRR